jgi:DNA-binding response OmpR family regulator
MTDDATRHAHAARPHAILALDEFGAWSRDGTAVAELTVTQFALLHFLACLPPGKVATYYEIAAAIRPFDRSPLGRKPVQWHIHKLKKVISNPARYLPPGGMPWPEAVIRTRLGHGYLLDWSISSQRSVVSGQIASKAQDGSKPGRGEAVLH